MNKQDNFEVKNQQATIEDLTINPNQAAEVKGGQHKDHKNWIILEGDSFPSRPGSVG